MYDLHRLALLRELQHRGTIRAVAAALHYSPSTVSAQLSVLEDEAGVPLLQAVGRRVRLTTQGEILARHADGILRQVDAARTELARSVDAVTGTVRIAGFQSVLLSVVPRALSDLAAAHPELRVELLQAEPEHALPDLTARRLDLVIAEEYPGQALPRPDDVDHHDLCRDRLRVALPAGPAVTGSARLRDWEEVRGRPWVVEPEGCSSRRWLLDRCRSAGFEPDIRFETEDLLVHRRLVALGHAVAVLPDLIETGDDAGVTRLDLPDGPHHRRIVLAHHRSAAGSPALAACAQALSRHASDAVRAPSGR